MKKAKRTILYTLCLCTALLGFSCTKEMETEEHPAMPDVPCRVEFRIETEAATRATDHAVRNLNFYVYGNSGLVRSGYTISAFVPTMTLVPGTYRVYVVANAGSSLGQMDESELLVLSTPVTEQDGFLQNGAMYLSGMQTMTVAGSTTCRIVLRRAAAKISLNVRFGPEMEGARIVHVVPGNAPATGSVFGENRLTAADPQIEFPYPDLSSGNLSTLSMSYYQYENLAGSVGSITDPADRIDGKAPATASYVSIRVLWDGAYFDYKVYLGSNTTSDFNVRRNTLYDYDVTIEGVNADDLRIAMTEIIFWVGRKLSIGGRYYRDGFYWNARSILPAGNSHRQLRPRGGVCRVVPVPLRHVPLRLEDGVHDLFPAGRAAGVQAHRSRGADHGTQGQRDLRGHLRLLELRRHEKLQHHGQLLRVHGMRQPRPGPHGGAEHEQGRVVQIKDLR